MTRPELIKRCVWCVPTAVLAFATPGCSGQVATEDNGAQAELRKCISMGYDDVEEDEGSTGSAKSWHCVKNGDMGAARDLAQPPAAADMAQPPVTVDMAQPPVTVDMAQPPAPTCTSFTYSAYGACQPNGTQTRTVLSSSPAGCTGGSPVLTQTCTYIDGAALYTQYCFGCHGTSKKGSPATNIQNAINNNTGGMGSLSFLTPAQIAAISAAP